MNKADSSIITQILQEHGYEIVGDPNYADIFIVNTCSVRAHAEARALGYISTMKPWRNKDGRILAVVGCMAKRLENRLFEEFHFVDLILGPDSYRTIDEYVKEIVDKKNRIIETALHEETYCGIHPKPNGVASFVPIMRGCNNFCSYCVVPFVRGHAASRNFQDIVKEIEDLVDSGVKDITLLGQNVNEYSYQGTDFADLLKICTQIPGLFRLRFLTSHPKDLSDKIIETIHIHRNICEWFHLPLQSGCNRILELMNRRYTKESYLRLIEKIRQVIPEASITTDVIVGFPTETEEEFLETISVLDKVKFDDAYMYCYSPREGTKAFQYESAPEAVIKKRLQTLIDFQNKIVLDKTKAMIGKKFEVLFETRARNKGSRGKTRGNKDVVVEKDIELGSVHEVIIKKIIGKTPVGELPKP